MTDSKRKKRPADANQLAKFIVDVSTGEEAEAVDVSGSKSKSGKKGARARAAALTPEQRTEIARTAALARWKRAD